MKNFTWDEQKNRLLQETRGVSFEEVVLAIERGDVLDILKHHNSKKYSNQRVFVVKFGDYAYLVPFVESFGEVFLKTIIPSRKATRIYLR